MTNHARADRGLQIRTCADGTPYSQAFNDQAPQEVRDAVNTGMLLWSVPWRGGSRSYFELYDTIIGPVLKTDIFIGWAYAWDWPDTAAAIRYVRHHTAELDLAGDYLRRRTTVLLSGPWGIVIERQPWNIRAILHTEHGPQTRWYQTPLQALDAAAAHSRDVAAWSDRLHGSDPAARAAEREQAVAAASAALAAFITATVPEPDPPAGTARRRRRIRRAAARILAWPGALRRKNGGDTR